MENLAIDAYEKGYCRYWVLYETGRQSYRRQVAVFLHGFGTNNPACYGGWIKHLIAEGCIVIYPKFQNGVFLPRTRVFQKRARVSILKGLRQVEEQFGFKSEGVVFYTHSLGGIIAANLANDPGFVRQVPVLGMLLGLPGVKVLPLGRLKSYANVPEGVKTLVITAKEDYLTGQSYARKLYAQIRHLPETNKLWLEYHSTRLHGKRLVAGHVNPISPDRDLDTGNRNFFIWWSLNLCRIGYIDHYVYYECSSRLLDSISAGSFPDPKSRFVPEQAQGWVHVVG